MIDTLSGLTPVSLSVVVIFNLSALVLYVPLDYARDMTIDELF